MFFCIGFLGIPLIIALSVAYAAACLYGWFAVGTLIGQRLLEILKVQNASLIAAAAIGTGLITLLSALPCLGFFVGVILGPAGLGAVILTRFGSQIYTPSAPMPPSRPTPPTPPTPPIPAPGAPSPEAPAALGEPAPDIPAAEESPFKPTSPAEPEASAPEPTAPATPVEPEWPDIATSTDSETETGESTEE